MALLFFLSTVVVIEACRHGELVLSGGATRYEGRVDVCLNGRWNTICQDSHWGHPEAWVICRQLGFLENQVDYRQTYPPGNGPILSEVECFYSERRLIECNYKLPPANCTHAMDAGVSCRDGGTPTNLQYIVHGSRLSLSWNASVGEAEILQHYLATCSSWSKYSTDLIPQHTVQVYVSTNTTIVLIQGLNFNVLHYNCCVAANYVTYSPIACVFINTTQEEVYNTSQPNNYLRTEITTGDVKENNRDIMGSMHVTTNNKTIDPVLIIYVTRANTVLLTAMGSVLGFLFLGSVIMIVPSVICIFMVYKKHKSFGNNLKDRISDIDIEGSHQQAAVYEDVEETIRNTCEKREAVQSLNKSEDVQLEPNLCYAGQMKNMVASYHSVT